MPILNPLKQLFFSLRSREKNASSNIPSRKLTHQERLAAIDFPDDKIPERYLDKLSFEIMDCPVVIDMPIGSQDHDWVADKNYLASWFEKAGGCINPWTNEEIHTQTRDILLEEEIELFVLTEEIKHHFKCLIPHTFMSRLIETSVNFNQIPTKFLDYFGKTTILNYPVKLDHQHVIDLEKLIEWWENNPENSYLNPFTFTRVNSIMIDETLYKEINDFVSYQEDICFKQQFALVKETVQNKNQDKPYHQTLLEINFPMDRIPAQLIGQNFVEEIMTHPVRIDDAFTLDFQTLMDWWKEDPQNLYMNFYTGKKIKKIEYDVNLKSQIDQFISNAKSPLQFYLNIRHQFPQGFLFSKPQAPPIKFTANNRVQELKKSVLP